MKTEEGMTLAKMAVTAMFLSIVVGAVFTLWYLLSDPVNDAQAKMQKAANSAAAERMYELQDMSLTAANTRNYDDYPLVTNTCNVLTEFNEDSLLFVYTVEVRDETVAGTFADYSNAHLFTYDNINVSIPSNFPGASLTRTVHQGTLPLTEAVRELLPNSKNRCNVKIVDYNPNGTVSSGSNTAANPMLGIVVEVLVK